MKHQVAPLIALVAAVALGSCSDSTTDPNGQEAIDFLVSAMAGDLTRLATAETNYHTAHGAYTVQSSDLSADLPQWPTPGDNLLIQYTTASGWGATASTPVSGRQCGIYIGPAPATPLIAGLALTSGVAGCQP